MEHLRCARCRNPIRLHQRAVRHLGVDRSFHEDCWGALQSGKQEEYLRRVTDEGLDAVLSPYSLRGPEEESAEPPTSLSFGE